MVGTAISHYRPQSREKPNAWLVLLTALLAVMVFLVDLSIPLGVAGGVPYIAVVLVSLWLPGKRYTILVATLCTGLTILGLYVSVPGGELWKVLANRFLAVFAIWVTATLSLQRKRSEENLRESEENNRMLVENSPYCIHQIDTEARLISMNPAGLQMMGVIDEDEIIQMPYLDVVANEDRDRIGELIELALQGKSFQCEFRGIDGRIFQSAFVPITDRSGAVSRLMGLTQDITEPKRAEAALRETEELLLHAQKMEALGRLTGGLAHDFRNLLMGVMGCCRLAEDTLVSDNPARSYIEEIITLAETGAVFTRQLLTFSQKREVQLKPILINSVISAMEGMLRRLLGEDIVLRVILSRSGAPMMADQGHVEQILINLIVNARDAMGGGGELTIKTANIDLEEGDGQWQGNKKPGPYVLLVVSDRGCGMDEAMQARIFEPFFTTKENEGTGLGLSTVYGIVKQLGGEINVDSTLGGGTTFSLLFPRSARARAVAEAAKDEEALPGGSETVLVVEDNRLVRLTVRSYLEDLGYEVLEAGGPVEGLRVFEEHSGPVELLVTDMVLPQMSGRELARRVQAQVPSVKTLYMSAYPADFLEEKGRLKVGDLSLEKPFTKSALATKVREVLDQHIDHAPFES